MGIYRDNLSAITFYQLSLSLKIILIHRLPLSLLLYILLSPINYRDKRFLRTQCLNFKVSELALWKKLTVSSKTCCNLENYFFVLHNFTTESVNCSLFLRNIEKTFLQFALRKKNFVKHIENLPQQLSGKFIGNNLSITDIALKKLRFIGIAQGFFEVIDYRYRFSTERFIVPITGYTSHIMKSKYRVS